MEVFRRLLPGPLEGRFTAADLAAAVPGAPPAGRPFVMLNMIATADGRATIEGRTAPLANRADYELFHALRERVDAVMVGAGDRAGGGLRPAGAARRRRLALSSRCRSTAACSPPRTTVW